MNTWDNSQFDPTKEINDKYNKSVFVWLDILGYSEKVEDESSYTDLSNCLTDFSRKFNRVTNSSKIIGDGIFLEITELSYSNIANAFAKIGRAQLEFLIDKQMFIRGGISYGSIHNDEYGNVISNGVARAVKIENKCIDWPVIGTTGKVVSRLHDITNQSSRDFGLRKAHNINGDELYFIDFLSYVDDSEKQYNKEIYFNLLNDTIKKLYTNNNKGNILRKYHWLLRYYIERFGNDKATDVCSELSGLIL